jgi:hypothetical protein
MRTENRSMVDPPRFQEVSAAVDGEASMPEDLTAEETAFRDAALRLRGALRLDERTDTPDVSADVLRHISAPSQRRRPTWLAAAAVFVVAAVAAGLALRPGGPAEPDTASADVSDEVVGAQRVVTSFDARVVLVERGVHPDVDERRLTGTLRYEAPETIWLELEESGTPSAGWPANDLELVVDDGIAWRRGLVGCPVGAQPECLRHSTQSTTDLVPFAEGWVSPLDLVMPVGAFLPTVPTSARAEGDRVVVESTVARVDQLLHGLRAAGAIRSVHPTDRAVLELDTETLTLRGLTVIAADNVARATWNATNGYHDSPGDVLIELHVDESELPPAEPAAPPAEGPHTTAGFTDAPVDVEWDLPDGFSVHRTGHLDSGGPVTTVIALSDGRAWIRVELTREWDQPHPFGDLGPLAHEIPIGDGVGYTDPGGTKVSVHTDELDVVVSGSVDTDQLVEVVAANLTGRPIESWQGATAPSELPAGALVPTIDHIAVVDDGTVVIGMPAPGRSGITLVQRPAAALPPPPRADVVETDVREVSARYAPELGSLTWLEEGWLRVLSAPGLDLAQLRRLADGLVEP